MSRDAPSSTGKHKPIPTGLEQQLSIMSLVRQMIDVYPAESTGRRLAF